MNDPVFQAFAEISEQPQTLWPALVKKRFPSDLAQRTELERMLAASLQETTSEITETSDAVSMLQHVSLPDAQPEAMPVIADIQLFEEVGRGSAGVVYRGLQSAPVARTVAVKVFHRDSTASGFVRREAGVLARLNHPGVASIHSVGTAPDGRAFSVLEYVDGLPITDYVRDSKLDLAGSLRLIVQLCDAVAHANEAGVVHRDLKPANVLVGERDGLPAVKVLDFSIA
ncbi:MAG: protein kinase, partial [Planctomycetota bacterium]